jgi:transposase InsO family protein
MKSRNYKFIVSVGVSNSVLAPVVAVLDTGAGPNLIREDVLPPDWESLRLRGVPVPKVMNASGRLLHSKGVIVLIVQVGDLRTRVRFYVTAGLAVPCILGCNFIDRHVRSIMPGERRVELREGGSVAITEGSPGSKESRKDEPPASATPSTKVRVAKAILLPPRSEAHVTVQTASVGLRFLQNKASTSESLGITMANGVADARPFVPFRVRVVNLSAEPRLLKKDMVLGFALPHPTMILTLPDCPGPDTEPAGQTDAENLTAVADDSWREEVALGHLGDKDRARVLDMLSRHRAMWDGHLGTFTATSHRIELVPDARPVHCQPYRAGPQARQAETTEVDKMLKAGVIEPATSEWASPVVLVPKPDGSLRFCIDYRRLNAITVRDTYPLPRMDECIDSLGDAVVFSTLDCNSGYWQIPLHESDRDKTTFCSHAGTFRFLRMPFGLRNAPATFQRAIDIILSGLKWRTCLVYLDDIIIYSTSREDHYRHVDEVLTTLGRAGLSLKLKKCHFFQEAVDYLGHVIRPGRLEVAEKNTVALKEAKLPKTQTELKSFLGLCNVYRRFVARFAAIAAPLTALLRKETPFQLPPLSEEQRKAFETLRERLLSPPVLALPRAEGHYFLDTDASATQLGCCLRQTQPDGSTLPLGFWSRSLTPAEKNYSTTEKECLAIVWAVTHLRPYLERQKFTVVTDHQALRWVMNLSDAQGRLARWRLRLAEFDFHVEYRPGASNHAADTMSRLEPPAADLPEEPVDTEIPVLALEDAMVRDAPPVVDAVDLLAAQQRDAHALALRGLLTEHESWDLDDNGTLGRILPSGEFEIYVPASVRPAEAVCFVKETEVIAVDGSELRRGEEVGEAFRASEHTDEHTEQSAVLAVETDMELTPIGIEELVREQATDDLCRRLRTNFSARSLFDVDERGLLVRIAPLDGARQIVVPTALVARLLHLEHYPRTVAHPGVTRMLRTIRRTYFWPNMAEDVLETVRQCDACARNRIALSRRTNPLGLFPAHAPLESVAMDILGPLPKTRHGNRFLLVIADRYTKLTRTVPMRVTTAVAVAQAFCDQWVFVYGPPVTLLTDNGPQFAAKFFQAACAELGIKKVFTTAYHPQTNGQVERYNRTLVEALRAYVSRRQDDWDEYTSAVTYAYNCRVHSSLGMPPMELVVSRPPVTISLENKPRDEDVAPMTAKREFLQRLRMLREQAGGNLHRAQVRYKRGYDNSVRETNKQVKEGDDVYVRVETPQGEQHSKLDSLAQGPYRVESNDGRTLLLRIGDEAVRVSSDRITRAPDSTTRKPDANSEEASPETPQGGDEFVVERLVDHGEGPRGGRVYRVRWYGYGKDQDTWEPEGKLPQQFIRRYWRHKSTTC